VGKNYLALGDYDAAIESFETAAEVDPGNVEALYRLGRAHYDRGEVQQAQEYLKQATEVDPRFGPAFGYLAFTYWSRRNYEDAIPNLQRAIMLDAWTARRQARGFLISLENRQGGLVSPSSDVVMNGAFDPVSLENTDTLQASLTPSTMDEAWQGAQGSVTLDTRTGVYTVTLDAMPATRPDQAYVGWFEGIRTLSGDPFNTRRLNLDGGSVQAQFEATWVQGPRIDYFYTLGLAHFFLDECDKAYPLFDAALQIDPEDQNARRGVQLCDEAESD
jgi:tetratricopeptide (TPR) repeat protein